MSSLCLFLLLFLLLAIVAPGLTLSVSPRRLHTHRSSSSWSSASPLYSLAPAGSGLGLDPDTLTNVVLGLGVAGASLNFASYWSLQLETARVLGGVPRGSVVTELDALDGKNIFYLPEGIDYTAVMLSSQQGKDKAAINEQLILESIGKANAQGGRPRQGKLRSKSQDIRPKSQDVVLSIGAIGRCSDGADKAIVVNEAFRLLKPGGLFVFLEPGGDDVVDLITTFFPKEIVESRVAVEENSSKKRQTGFSAADAEVEPPRVKPGIVSTPVSVPLRSFITGICIRP